MKKNLIFISALFTILSLIMLISVFYTKKPTEIEKIYDSILNNYSLENKKINENNIDVDIVFIGDSITAMLELCKDQFDNEYYCLWRGIGGDNTFTMQERLKVSLFDINPKVIVMCIGGNNIYTMLQNYEDIISSIKYKLPNTKLIVHSIYPTNYDFSSRNEYIPSLNISIKEIVEKYGYIYVDTHSLVVDEEGKLNKSFTEDGAHLNIDGYNTILKILKPVIDDVLN